MMFWNSVKTATVAVAATLVVAGVGGLVAQEVAQRKAADKGGEAAARPFTATVQTPTPAAKAAALFSSRAWRNDEASRDLARAGIRVFNVGGWGFPGAVGWATPAELRRRPMPAADYVNAWATSRAREVLWLSDAKVTVTSGSLRLDRASGVSVLEGGVKVELPGTSAPITGKRAEYHQGKNTLVVDGVSIPLPEKKVAIIGTTAELDALKQRAGGESASTEAILAKLDPKDGRPLVGGERPAWEPEQDQATLRKAFHEAPEGRAKWDAAMALCAAGGDDGLAYLKAELANDRAVPDAHQRHNALEALGAHGGPEAIQMLQAFLADRNAMMASGAGLALGRNGSEAALAILRQALASDDADTAFGAACSLELVGGKPGLELAALALAQTDPKVRRAGAFAAYRAHGERALPLLEKALGDADAGVRRMAATGLENVGGDKARALLEKAVKDFPAKTPGDKE